MRHDWAIIIGINRYRYVPRLYNAVSDAQAVKKVLISDYGFGRRRIRILCDQSAKRSRILNLINVVVPSRWKVGRGDQLFFFFAGHADRARRGRRSLWYLAPVDARQISRTRTNWESVLTSDEIRKLEKTFSGSHIFYVLDCCYSGMAFIAEVPAGQAQRGRSAHALVAGRAREPVPDKGGSGHSVFTESLIQALGGWGGLGGATDASFKANDLINFMKNDVPAQIRQRRLRPTQRPFGGPLVGNPQGTEYTFRPIAPRLSRDTILALLNEQVRIRQAAVSSLAHIDKTEMLPAKLLALARLSRDPSPSVRHEVAVQLCRTRHPSALPLLVPMLRDREERVALAAVRGLSELARGNTRAISYLKRLRNRGSSRFRRTVERSLALLGSRNAVRNVVRELPTEEGSIRREIIDVLRSVTPTAVSREELTSLLVTLLRSEDWRERRAAAEAVGELGLDLAVDGLIQRARSPAEHFMVRQAAIEALGHLGRASVRNVVCSALEHDGSLNVRTAAAEALGILGGDDAIQVLMLSLSEDPEWRVRRAGAESCGFLRESVVVPTLIHATADPHFRVRIAVAWALGEINDDTARPALEQMLAEDHSLHVKHTVQRAIERLDQ